MNTGFGIFVGFLMGVLLGVCIYIDGRNTWKHEAVTVGHAEYYLDENYIRQWRWKDESQ